jgi:hypothetical protein
MRDTAWLLLLVLTSGCGSNDGGAVPEDVQTGGAGPDAASGGGGGAGRSGGGAGGGGSRDGGGTGGVAATGGTKDGGGAGSSGDGGGPPHVVGACDGLGAVDQLENITPPGVDLSGNGITQILVDRVNAGTIYVGTDKKGLHKSTDCGATWAKVNTGRNADIMDGGTLWSMALDYVEPDVIYAGSLYSSDSSLFKSTNGGVDWDSLFPAGSEVAQTVEYNFFQDLSMDPTDHKHIVVSFHANCKGATGAGCMAETKDSGATWRIFKNPTGGWEEGAAPLTLGPTTWLLRTVMNGLYYTSDSGATWEKVGPGACPQAYHAANGTWYAASLYGVFRSADGHAWTKIDGSPNGYGIVGDGKRIFDSLRDSGSGQQPYLSAPESDPTTWTTVASPNMAHGGVYLGYDADHHLLYSANTASGFWRMVTQ